jgi:hypothetical protein
MQGIAGSVHMHTNSAFLMQNIIVQLTLDLWLKFNAYHHHSAAMRWGAP